MPEGTNPESLVEDYDFTGMKSGENTDTSESDDSGGNMMSGDLGGILNSEPHKPIDDYNGVSLNFKDGSKYLERGIDKLTGWPAILDIGMGIVMMVFGRTSSTETESENVEEQPEESSPKAEEINEELRKQAQGV